MDDLYKDFQTEALKKLEDGAKAQLDRHGEAMKKAVRDALADFCRQDGEFAQAVAQGGTFADCMKAVAKNVGSSISDVDAYRRAVQFFFPGADIRVQMTVDLCASVDGGEPEPDGKIVKLDLLSLL
ncbi:MAG: hypothetical protein IJT18_08010 [Oscillospiraceae bacterium]|nr:hypothetical protein [Oscillospiraceae bacterium]